MQYLEGQIWSILGSARVTTIQIAISGLCDAIIFNPNGIVYCVIKSNLIRLNYRCLGLIQNKLSGSDSCQNVTRKYGINKYTILRLLFFRQYLILNTLQSLFFKRHIQWIICQQQINFPGKGSLRCYALVIRLIIQYFIVTNRFSFIGSIHRCLHFTSSDERRCQHTFLLFKT